MNEFSKRRWIISTVLLVIVIAAVSSYSIRQYYSINEFQARLEETEREAEGLKSSYALAGYYLYVPNTLDGTVSVVDLLGDRIVATITVGASSSDGIASSPDGRYVYAGSNETGQIAIIETSTNTVSDFIKIDEQYLHGIDISPDGKQLWTVGEKVTVVDTTTKSVIKQIPFWSLGHVDFSKDGQYAYMTTLEAFGAENDLVVVFDTNSLSVTKQVEARTSPNEVELSPDGSFIYVANYDSDDVTILDSDLNVLATVPAGKGAHGLAISPDGRWLYVANRKTDYVSVIDTVNRKETNRIRVGDGPNHITITPDGKLIYVSNIGSADISIINTQSLTVVGSIRVGNAPHEMEIIRFYQVRTGLIEGDWLWAMQTRKSMS